ncbi:CHASE2 domain-containing protein [Methylobacterium oryzihabitans]|uniref:Adenylate/guanylate cyclase domain-containing protein n=1 Tax=Methylobacterium oryzihabitans TaxID=2499852 RepID=A0A437NV08_9HYPH|nr:adenylate/guanylate cyclase domain-containing protein [Methylobacterium oryzihabitans]RVU13869.1 adenylate/guanylate cyclase domain-containing protein [Methylobacterium oryzihabitans]
MARAAGSGPRLALTAAAVAASLAFGAFLSLPHLAGEASSLDRAEAALADLRFLVAGPRPAPGDVVIVAIDERTIAAAGGYPLPRAYLARVLQAMRPAAPRAVAIDVLFLDPGPEAADAELARALAALPAVIGAAAVFPRTGPDLRARYGPFAGLPVASALARPHEPLRGAAREGLVNVAADPGGTPRHLPLLVAHADGVRPSLVLAAATLAAATLAAGSRPRLEADRIGLGETVAPLDLGASLALRFYGPQGSLTTVSAAALLAGEIDAAALRGRLLVLGAVALGSGDRFSTPFDPVMPGVEVLATGLSHLIHGDALRRDATVRRADAAMALVLPVLMLLGLSLPRVGLGLALAALPLAAFLGAALWLFGQGVWLSMALPLAAALAPLPPYLAARMLLDRAQARRLAAARDDLLRFLPPAVATRLAQDPDFLAVPVERRACVLFLDLSGFTTASEGLGPARTREMLKAMHDRVEAEATARGGAVTSFMGDGAMVLFGLPEAGGDDADRTVAAALALVATLRDWLAAQAPGEAPAGLRIGAHEGPVVLSRLGGARNQHITATGDTVNTTARLLDVAKAEGVALVLSEALLAARREPVPLPHPGRRARVAIRGRRAALDVVLVGA